MHIYVERLNAYVIIFYLLPELIKAKIGIRNIKILYFNTTTFIGLILKLYNCSFILKFTHEFRNILDNNGECINSKFSRIELFKIQNYIENSDSYKYYVNQDCCDDNLKHYLNTLNH